MSRTHTPGWNTPTPLPTDLPPALEEALVQQITRLRLATAAASKVLEQCEHCTTCYQAWQVLQVGPIAL